MDMTFGAEVEKYATSKERFRQSTHLTSTKNKITKNPNIKKTLIGRLNKSTPTQDQMISE